ncbi:MAG: signal peptidase II [Verrucomicrobiota bacterium]
MNSQPVEPSASPAVTSPWWERVRTYRLLWALGLSVFVLDQITKVAIAARLPYPTYGEPGAISVIDGFFYLVHVGNTGAAWSLLAGKSLFLAVLAALTLGAIFVWRRHLGLKQRPAQIAFGLLCGGIVGNLVDRLIHGHVIDFIDLHFGSYVYPTFNVADCGICIGVGIYVIHSLREPADGTGHD